jgi:predicted Zn-ribbon and HTH transcriptional regulator
MTVESARRQSSLEVADILRVFGQAYRDRHPVSPEQALVMKRLARCRTAALGGHVDACGGCGFTRVSYNSCRDRHCPKCQAGKRAAWLQTRLERLLPVDYFHVVFTLPDLLWPLMLRNQRLLYQPVEKVLDSHGSIAAILRDVPL